MVIFSFHQSSVFDYVLPPKVTMFLLYMLDKIIRIHLRFKNAVVHNICCTCSVHTERRETKQDKLLYFVTVSCKNLSV